MLKPIIIAILLLCVTASYAQIPQSDTVKITATDTVAHRPLFCARNIALPLALMAWGTVEVTLAPHVQLLNQNVANEVIEHNPPKFTIDDYTQYAPAATVFALNLAGVHGRHSLWQCTALLAMSGVLTAISVNTLKYTVRERRPDGSQRNSFPSGHTATAFMGAEFLWQEYKDVSPWVGLGGYAVATLTGALRVYNNRHWVGDIMFGAGLGMLCTKTAYWLYPRIRRHFKAPVAVAPFYNPAHTGVTLAMTF